MAELGRIEVCPGKKLAKIRSFNAHPASAMVPKRTTTELATLGTSGVHPEIREQGLSVIDFSPASREADIGANESQVFSPSRFALLRCSGQA